MSLQILQVKGIPIRLHFTLVIAFFLIAWTLASRLMPATYPGMNTSIYWIMGITGAIILFISVLLHELAHSVVALRYGLKVRQILLFIFGGVSDIEDQDEEVSKDFTKEFKIAVVGPITSFVIAGVLAAASWLLIYLYTGNNNIGNNGIAGSTNVAVIITVGVLQYGSIVNILLGGFNLIPAFPLDGGRILRSALLRWKKDYDQSTKIAAKVGIAISYGFMAFGFLSMFSGSFIGGIWILLIGWFLNNGAQSYIIQQELTSTLSSVKLGDIMNSRIIFVRKDIRIDHLIHDYFNTYAKDSFPVVDEYDRLVGMVTFKDAWNVQEDKRILMHVADIMIQKSNLIIIQRDRTAYDALRYMTRRRMSRVFICDQEGKLIGLVSKTDIMNAASERKEYVEAVRKFRSNHHSS